MFETDGRHCMIVFVANVCSDESGIEAAGAAGCLWLTPVILAPQETAVRRIEVRSQPGQIVRKTLILKNPSQKRLVTWLKW
jgi:hypothetical protein